MSIAITPDFEKFSEQYAKSSVVPLSATFILENTPLSLLSYFPEDSFVCLLESLGRSDKEQNTNQDDRLNIIRQLLESLGPSNTHRQNIVRQLLESLGPSNSEGNWRYHILGFDPKATFSFDGKEVTEHWKGEAPKKGGPQGVIRQLDDFLRSFHSVYEDSTPLLGGGLIGYVSRDLLSSDFDRVPHDAEIQPLVHFVVPQTFVIVDSLKQSFTLSVNAFSHGGKDAQSAYDDAKQLLEARVANLQAQPRARPSSFFAESLPKRTTDEPDTALADQARSLTDAAKSKQVFQVYLNHSVTQKTSADPLSVYRVFRMVYPSAYCYLFRINGSHYIGSHELADAPHSLSFANLLRHVLKDARFVGTPSDGAVELRRAVGLRYRQDSSVFGYVGFNGRYKLTHGNKELVLKAVESGYEATFSQAAHANWEGISSATKPTLTVSNAGSASATIGQILTTVESLKKP